MTARERILLLNLLQKAERAPEHFKRLGIEIFVKEKVEKTMKGGKKNA